MAVGTAQRGLKQAGGDDGGVQGVERRRQAAASSPRLMVQYRQSGGRSKEKRMQSAGQAQYVRYVEAIRVKYSNDQYGACLLA